MVVYGAHYFGKTLRVPGVMSVSTRCLHVMFFPMVPRSSWIFVSKKARQQLGLSPDPIPLPRIRWRSVLLAWIRGILVFAGLVATLVAVTQYLVDKSMGELAPALLVVAGTVAAYVMSYRLDRATHDEIESLLAEPGVPPALVKLAAERLRGLD